MGLFNRNKDIEIKRDNQELQTQEHADNYSPMMNLSFNLQRLLDSDNNCLSAFYAGIELISNSLASVPIIVKDKETDFPVSHPVTDIFSKNVSISKFLLIKQLISDAYRYGDGFAYIKRGTDGRPVELIYRPHGSVSIIYNEQTLKLYYLDTMFSSKKIEPVNMIHIRKNTNNGVNGISISQIGTKIFSLAKSTDSTAKDFFDSGCNISGVLTSDKMLNPKAKQEILDDWRSAFNKTKANNVGVLGYDMKYTPVSSNANESQLLQSREFNVLEIARYLNCPPQLLAVTGSTSYGSLEQAQLDLIIHTLMPWICMLEEEFNNKLILPSEKDKVYIDFDEDKIMFASKTDTANYYTNLVKNGIMSVNEARLHLGLTEREGADELIIPYTNINDNKVNQQGEEKNEPEKEDENKQ